MNAWATAVGKYVAVMAELREPLTADAIRAVRDALTELRRQHDEVLERSMKRAEKRR